MTELIFGYKKKFGSGHFLIFFQISWIEKMPRAKKVINIREGPELVPTDIGGVRDFFVFSAAFYLI